MKRFVVLALAAAVLLSGCEAYNNTNKAQRGAVIGAAAGGLLGAILGNNLGDGQNSELGAVLGTVVGGAAGAVIGNQMDKQAKKIEEEIPGAEVKRVDDGIVVTFDENSGVYFATAKHDINQKSKETLDKLVSILNEYPETNVLVAGYTDNVGKAEYNMGLSKRRAQAVTNYFTSKGLVASRFTTKWYGKENPVADNATPEGRAKNRRVNVIIVPNEKMKADAEKSANQK
ncbi:MAG: OmpA family protein [Capnocytophaga sp.]|uniref:OmpA family protein n=1 Tax=Capnocytophaga sp. TaxID=44737 RepID=UPI003F9EF0A4